MPVLKSVSNDRRVTLSKYSMSQFTNAAANQKLYQNLANASDSQMMKADNLLFDPKLMIGSSGLGYTATDPSFQRFEHLQIMPVYYYLGSFVLLLVVLKYLTK